MRLIFNANRRERLFRRSFLSLVLIIVLLFGLLPTTVFAASAYTMTAKTDATILGKSTAYNGTELDVYKVTLDTTLYDSITFYKSCAVELPEKGKSPSAQGITTITSVSSKDDLNYTSGQTCYTTFSKYLTDEIKTQIKGSVAEKNVIGFFWYQSKRGKVADIFGFLIIEWPDNNIPEVPDANIDALQETVKKVTGENADNFYHSGDRWNGRHWSEAGFWADMQPALTTAQNLIANPKVEQSVVDDANTALSDKIAELIPITEANSTALYETVNTTWCWQQGELSDTTGTPVSADNCTAITWDAYEAAWTAAKTLLDSLYVDGTAPAIDRQPELDAAVSAADPHKLVNADLYNTAYENYQSRKAEAEALIEQYDPAKLSESDYSAETWAAYVSAYNVLKADMEYRIVRGTTEDYAMLKAFNGYYAYNESGQWTHYPAHIDALKDARKQLASTKNVAVFFTYINNFSALYEGFRGSGTDLYVNTSLGLTSGNATLGAAFDLAGITVDTHNDTTLPGLGTSNNGDENPVFALYINGSHYGDYRWGSKKARWNNVQLHDGDAVRLVRIPLQMFNSEDSSGYDSSKVSILPASPGFGYYESSYAMIHATAPSGTVKVGDETAFSATVTGAYAGASGSKSAENITLFISDPSETETLSQPTHKTTATTDASGNLEYIFREPGYYTVAMFNVTPDDMTYKSVYGEVTIGEYYSLYAGDYAIVHVTEAADINALIAKYRSENLAAAKAYYESFHDYDFTTADYRTFTSAYSTLKSNQNSATTFKNLMDSFDADYAALQVAGANALDHAAILASLRKNLSYLPDDLTTLTASDKDFVVELQTAYAALNAYQKSLLTANERATLEALAKINANELPAVATVNLRLSESGTFPHKTDNGNPYYGWPEIKWVISPRPDGSVPNPTWAKETTSMPTSANAGRSK